MKYNKATIKAIKESLAHHEDNLRKLQTSKGKFEWDMRNKFNIGHTIISYNGDDCALCVKYENDCYDDDKFCPLALEGQKCNMSYSAWRKIDNAQTKKSAIKAEKNMVEVLKKLLK